MRDVSFHAQAGEITGIAGLVGCGKSELIRAIYGLEPITGGSIHMNGQPAEQISPAFSLSRGICYFPADALPKASRWSGQFARTFLSWRCDFRFFQISAGYGEAPNAATRGASWDNCNFDLRIPREWSLSSLAAIARR